jgi:hypothetical protein
MMSEAKHSPLPWMPSPLGFAMNDGAVPVMSVGDPDGDRVRVALVDCHTKYKRGEGHKVKCPIRDANLALILRAVNSHAEMLAALRNIECLEDRADGTVGMVDEPHKKALRAAAAIARAAIAKATQE